VAVQHRDHRDADLIVIWASSCYAPSYHLEGETLPRSACRDRNMRRSPAVVLKPLVLSTIARVLRRSVPPFAVVIATPRQRGKSKGGWSDFWSSSRRVGVRAGPFIGKISTSNSFQSAMDRLRLTILHPCATQEAYRRFHTTLLCDPRSEISRAGRAG
jgi:hypothetical protein